MIATQAGAAESRRCRRAYEAVLSQFDRLESLSALPDDRLFQRADAVSRWSVADHLSHIARSIQAMVGAIEAACEPGAEDSGGGPTFPGHAVLLTGWIPRGVGEAPEYMEPQAESSADVARQLEVARQAVERLEPRLPEIERARGRVRHFAFGALTPLQWLRVIAIHTRHHLKIIRAIQRAARSGD
ncbi:MAG: DUF1569 domain-containing protein [Gemmatimonadetes bacterium]|uniref:DinB family protein n=1 Tax=Candidatus Kutchimonas denitrificans TaxID=3056748 RepID=A0AAE4ZAR6_9BACT|nr:DinB family protein [Gemmatimonadota bacterium]NIR75777.1 DinB family protein [Candidatus Kutchimonas denitrificans]NIT66040.1 DinB family protein [Gemmatimonadota bacterium]NIY34618.1 DUF1569 domain-containing protein [Gemmatimonadota bacterium]NIY42855.1 DUF1569 domain-containing protein [Gemmatimonadota bacterium]